ncbi:MAG: NAD-binding protein [Clostridia bacterium]|nr:NAD-binding protein [Clostridia bacterium]
MVYIPDGNFELRAGDRVGVTASHGDMLKLMKKVGMPHKMPKSVILLGASRMSYYLAKRLISLGSKVKIVDQDREACEAFSARVPSATMIVGDGMQPEVLLEEGIGDADAFIALTGSDEVNVLSSFFAAEQKVPTVIAKVNKPDLAQTAEKLGLRSIVSPQKSVSDVLSRYARALHNSIGSNVETLYKMFDGKAEVLEFNVRSDFKYCDIPLREIKLKENTLIAGIVRYRKPILPSGDDVILPGDKVIVMTAGHVLLDLSDIIA